MGSKQPKIDRLLAELGVGDVDRARYYAGYFACFNRQLFYEAHEAMEEIWLPARLRPDGNFYKGLIQLAGAFVHLQKGKWDPAARLFRMSRQNLDSYPVIHHGLDLTRVKGLIEQWLERIARKESYQPECAPTLELLDGRSTEGTAG